MKRRALTKPFLVISTLLLALDLVTAGERGVPGIDGIGNFAKIDEKLYRGAQPNESGMQSLKQLGAKSIIDLRMPAEVRKEERAAALANGILYTNVPLRGLGAPRDEQVKTVLDLIETLPPPVFIHCVHGCDRTGTMVACYRIAHHQWSNEAALAEAKRYGLSGLERAMKKYIKEFGVTPKKPTPPQGTQ
ncbi:MAG TPA: tyrosine-protein phosphatase [Candidatus Acidoferrum sp.]|jgi:tyrosine-protein phosphatase SIW14|nr:tyrosine-protein phosphatase [Candidatus Acidoferrum sp.]